LNRWRLQDLQGLGRWKPVRSRWRVHGRKRPERRWVPWGVSDRGL